eukprot:36202-Eustigmatos_ZCMA.PRE.1
MLETGVIRPSMSPWSSPVVLVPKPDGSIRFCVDYRKINTLCENGTSAWPLPRIDEVLDQFKGAKYFTSLDLKSAYH